MAKTVNSVFVRVYELSCFSCEWVGKAAFLSHSPVPVWVWDRVRLTLITGGLSVPYCPLAAGLHGAVSHGHSSLKLAVFIVSRPGAVRLSTGNHSSLPITDNNWGQWWRSHLGAEKPNLYPKDEYNGHFPQPLLPQWTVPSVFQASAFPAAELPPTIGLLWWLQVSHPQTSNTNMQAAQEGRDRHCKQTRWWLDVNQIYLQGTLNCSLRTERANNQAGHLSGLCVWHQKNRSSRTSNGPESSAASRFNEHEQNRMNRSFHKVIDQ